MTNQHVLDPSAVTLEDGRPTTTSLIVAEVFGKNHRDVLRAIRGLDCSEEFALRNFAQCSRSGANSKPEPFYRMTRDGFTFLCMGFTGKEAARWKEAYIQAFNRMEAELQQRNTEQYSEAEGAMFTGKLVELNFGRGAVHAEWDTAGNLWLGDLELDVLLGYKMKNSALALFHRYEHEFPEGSVCEYRDDRDQRRAIFTPMGWAVLARHSTRPEAPQLALAAVQHYVPPKLMEVKREDYQRLVTRTNENTDKFQRIAAASGELASAVADAYESIYLAQGSIEKDHPALMPGRDQSKTH
ncbi:Rha family transcriptional regulator [Pseudomonas kunmingensis]|uniref:Rha family transcriptional regulator n=1 Tax=Stutzerimonas kunmingensis TaxID=1211807 RepID=UPI001746E85F|nr:Rha family transcriptional regulator [Stutzerimonas kunmingensis]MBD3877421.1 Rha family transcriptional regulator [Stutzerimonas kunmingensis]